MCCEPTVVQYFFCCNNNIVIFIMFFHLFWHVNCAKSFGHRRLTRQWVWENALYYIWWEVYDVKFDCPRRYKMFLYLGQYYCTSVSNCNKCKKGSTNILSHIKSYIYFGIYLHCTLSCGDDLDYIHNFKYADHCNLDKTI